MACSKEHRAISHISKRFRKIPNVFRKCSTVWKDNKLFWKKWSSPRNGKLFWGMAISFQESQTVLKNDHSFSRISNVLRNGKLFLAVLFFIGRWQTAYRAYKPNSGNANIPMKTKLIREIVIHSFEKLEEWVFPRCRSMLETHFFPSDKPYQVRVPLSNGMWEKQEKGKVANDERCFLHLTNDQNLLANGIFSTDSTRTLVNDSWSW